VYYTTGQWLNPQGIGPDPESRHGEAKMRKKGWCTPSKKVNLRRYHNTLIKRDLYFDIDYDNKDYNEGIQMVEKLITELDQNVHYEHGTIQLVFSGSKGFHLIIDGYYDEALADFSDSVDEYLRDFVNKPNKNKLIEQHYKDLVTTIASDELLLDWMVTYDNRRIIRLPGTVHGKTMRLCQIFTKNDRSVIFDRDGDMVGYNPAPPIP
jgi:DNA primase catalytic subunit|tara:strand:+ start:2235 stop:2858 length:624 start_codon:yes stop_codon:yes gene_type:complete